MKLGPVATQAFQQKMAEFGYDDAALYGAGGLMAAGGLGGSMALDPRIMEGLKDVDKLNQEMIGHQKDLRNYRQTRTPGYSPIEDTFKALKGSSRADIKRNLVPVPANLPSITTTTDTSERALQKLEKANDRKLWAEHTEKRLQAIPQYIDDAQQRVNKLKNLKTLAKVLGIGGVGVLGAKGLYDAFAD